MIIAPVSVNTASRYIADNDNIPLGARITFGKTKAIPPVQADDIEYSFTG